jgi:hypothetical protein
LKAIGGGGFIRDSYCCSLLFSIGATASYYCSARFYYSAYYSTATSALGNSTTGAGCRLTLDSGA